MQLTQAQRTAAIEHLRNHATDEQIANFTWVTNFTEAHGGIVAEISAVYCEHVASRAKQALENPNVNGEARRHCETNANAYAQTAQRLRLLAAMGPQS